MRNKGDYIITGLVFILGICIYISVSLNSPKELKEDIALKNLIIETVEKSNEIEFYKITNFQWDTMYVFTPYSNVKTILQENGISNFNFEFNVQYQDTINMIAFVNKDKLVAFIELPRNYGGVDLSQNLKFSKEEAKFNIVKDRGISFTKK